MWRLLTIWHFFLNSVIIVNSELCLSICLLIDLFKHAAESKKVIVFYFTILSLYHNSTFFSILRKKKYLRLRFLIYLTFLQLCLFFQLRVYISQFGYFTENVYLIIQTFLLRIATSYLAIIFIYLFYSEKKMSEL